MRLPNLQGTARLFSRISRCHKIVSLLQPAIVINVYRKHYSSNCKGNSVLYKLRSRGLVQLKGPDVSAFLQGLVTSDVALLGTEISAQYSMLLNVQGRVIYDLLLYDGTGVEGEPTIWVECDRGLTEKFMSDIKKYKIRKKVSIENRSEDVCVLAGFGEEKPGSGSASEGVLTSTADPRVPAFGTRVLASTKSLGSWNVEEEGGYHERRLQWGIPEGPVDLPPGNCFPLESNLVYMNGVSFSKGCYLGQELTARTHHTGVTRKHLMPLVFSQPLGEIESDASIVNAKGKSAGKLRESVGQYGLGLIRLAEISDNLTVKTKSGENVQVTVVQPDWWQKD